MEYVFMDIDISNSKYNNELVFINCVKVDKYFKVSDKLKIYIALNDSHDKEIITLKDEMSKLQIFLKKSLVITYDAKTKLSFLINAIYDTKVDMSFWYLDLKVLLREKLFYDMDYKEVCNLYEVKESENVSEYMGISKKYMMENKIKDLDEFTSVKPRKWNCFFRGINYPEYLGSTGKYSYYMADLSEDKYPSYLFCLKEINHQNFIFEELVELKEKYNIKILMSILDLNEETLKITNDYYIISFGSKVDKNAKWCIDYINRLKEAAEFIEVNNPNIEITCYDTIKELDEKTKEIDKKIMDIIKSKIVREKQKWSRWD